MPAISVAAPAKLNLFLHIMGKRADGYHLLESLVAFTDLGDEIDIAPADNISLTLTGPFASNLFAEDNLVLRAAKLLQTYGGIEQGAHITLHKNIPIGAGLGGGSTDAAATLRGLKQLWQVEITDDAMMKLALPLGSDIPCCLLKKPAMISGIGEKLQPVAMPHPAWAVLVNPAIPLLTAKVYSAFKGEFSVPVPMPETIASFDTLVQIMEKTHNALETPAMTLLSVIGELLAALSATGGCALARMSGSGATCFGLYGNEENAKRAAADLKNKYPQWWCVATRLGA